VSSLTLKIKPVKLKQSVYIRVPNDIADLIGIDSDSLVTLNLEERQEKFLLIYSMTKPGISKPFPEVPELERYREKDSEQLAPLPTPQYPSEAKKAR